MSDTKLNGYTPDIAEENITALRTLFPDVCTEDKIDFEKLRQLLGEYADEKKERYNFTWNGKGRALKLSQTPSRGTLLPCKEESKDWDSTENLYIEGDNLEVLKLLQKSYHNAVKMIYIDPPYNTGKDFVYPDDFSDSVKNYKQITGQVDAEGKNISTNPETNGRYHTDWLNMMYPRLRLARSLLRDDGVIFISIDDNEVANLRKICDEVFGEGNFIGCAGRITKKSNNKGDYWAPNFDYLLTYVKNMDFAEVFFGGVNLPAYDNIEDKGPRKGEKYQLVRLYMSNIQNRNSDQRYWINCPDGSKVIPPGSTFPPERPNLGDGIWRWTKNKFEEERDKIVIKPVRSSNLLDQDKQPARWNVFTKTYLQDVIDNSSAKPNSFIEGYINQLASLELNDLKIPFDYAKPSALIKYLATICMTKNDDIILDFFSGSSTTAHAVMQLNAEDGGSRKFIMVQLPEVCDEKSEAFKAGYKTICDIGKERIRRAGDKIKSDLVVSYNGQKTLDGSSTALNPEDLDIGFKVFKLDTSNIVEWNPAEDLNGTLATYTDNYLHGRTEQDVVYELLLKEGYPLTEQIEEKTLAGKHIYSIQNGKLLICLDDHITTELAREIAKEKLQAESRIIFKDNGFASDSDKINTREILKAAGLKEEGFRTL